MSDIKFACPHCQQHIQAEPGYAGLEISCPACQGRLMVPQPVLSAAAPVQVGVGALSARAALSPPAMPTSSALAAGSCPSCGGPLARGAVLCTQCGYNLATRQRTVAGRPAPLGRPGTPQWETPWYKTAYPYVAFVIVLLAGLYLLGKENPTMMLAFLGTALVYSLTAHIIVVIAAFKESIGTGFLTLCVPFYGFYFVFKVCDNDTLKVLYTSAAIVNISVRFLAK